MSSTTVYLKIPQVKEVYETEVYLGMIADVHSSDRAAEAKAKAVKVTSFSGEGKEAAYVGISRWTISEKQILLSHTGRKGRKAASGSG